jgi:asparagine synthase (glutamine-hydrolysing)
MPGIVGLVTRMPRQQAESELRQMLSVMRHESFYTIRTWADEGLGLYLGWSAKAGSFSDEDVQTNEAGDVSLVFSGEEFPSPDLLPGLKQRGHSVCESGPAYLVHLYEEDSTFPAGLNGVFHGVVADRRRRTILVFNDRFGMHRLYYHEGKNATYFAAEAKAILAVRPETRRLNPQALAEAITLGCVVENRSIFESVHVLPPATAWTFECNGQSRRITYFDPKQWESQPQTGEEEFYDVLREAFERNLPRYFAGRERVGVSLTGGLDSRMIMAWQRRSPGSLPCYTWGSTYRDCQDVIVAREVARVCDQPHEVIPMDRKLLSGFHDYADRAIYLTDGAVDVGLAPDVYMNERARQIAPARMTGLYGGELLRRVVAFKHVFPLTGLFQQDLLPEFERARTTYQSVLQTHPVSFAMFRQAPWHHYSSLSLEESQVTMRSPFLDNDVVKAAFRAPASAYTNVASRRLIRDGNPALSRIPTDHGVGERDPLREALSYGRQRFTFRAEYAYDHGMPQWLARIDHRLQPLHLERLFLGRHKPLHFRVWYRSELAAYVREMLLDSRSLSRPYLERTRVEEIVRGHIRGDRNYTNEIHKLLKLELLHRNFVDGPPRAREIKPVTH